MDIFSKFRLDKKVAIVTGGGKGIGRSIALNFAHAGANIVVADKDTNAGEEVLKEINSINEKSLFIKTDVTKVDQIAELVEATKEEFGNIDILVNNVGIVNPMTPVINTSEEIWDLLIRVNLTSTFLCSKVASRVMLAQNRGNIINISSASGIRPVPGMAAYSTAKAGVISFTQTLSIELAKYNIRVNCIIPGAIETELGTGLRGSAKARVERAGIPLERIGHPEDIAFAAIYLASEASDYVTGASIIVNGGPYTRKGDYEMFINRFPELLRIQ